MKAVWYSKRDGTFSNEFDPDEITEEYREYARKHDYVLIIYKVDFGEFSFNHRMKIVDKETEP